jgi:putative Mg2+ transporter-C (MgtC) family protein
MFPWLEIIYRLGSATVTGSLIGIYFAWREKPAGMRTCGAVALASAAAVLAAEHLDASAAQHPDGWASAAQHLNASRVIQGVFAGVGFLGTGVILRREQRQAGRGVPTAATIWLTASLGVLCGLGTSAWPILFIAVVLTAFVVVVGELIDWIFVPREDRPVSFVSRREMINFILNRKDRPVSFDMPRIETVADSVKAASKIASAVADGNLTSTEAAELTRWWMVTPAQPCWRDLKKRKGNSNEETTDAQHRCEIAEAGSCHWKRTNRHHLVE